MKQFVNAYAPINHSALLCPIREAAKVWAVMTEAGSGATQEEKDAAQSAYRAAKRAAGIDEIWTPAKRSSFDAPPDGKPRPVFTEKARKARNQRYGQQTDERRRQETKENQAQAEKPRLALVTEAERADAKRAQDRVYGAARRAMAKEAAG